jgi:hypothetical protein
LENQRGKIDRFLCIRSERTIYEEIRERNQGNQTEESRYISNCWNFENISSKSPREYHEKEEVLDSDEEIDRQETKIGNQDKLLDGEDSNERQLRQNPIERVRVSEK